MSRGSTPAARAAAPNRSLMAAPSGRRRARGDIAAPFAQRPDGPGDIALDVAHVGRLAVGVGLAAADGDEQAVVALRVGDVALLERRGFRAPQPGDRHRRARGRAPRVEELGQVRGQAAVVEIAGRRAKRRAFGGRRRRRGACAG